MPAPERPRRRAQTQAETPITGQGRRIGIFGGTFDPPHRGHEAAARAVLETMALDRLLLVVANDPWQKSPSRPVTPAEDRFALARALATTVPGLEASRLEIDRGGPSYSIDTVEQLRGEAPGEELEIFLVIGADLVPALPTWERAAELALLVTAAVVSRPTTARPPVPAGWEVTWIDGPMVDVSSSMVRERLARGEPVGELVPPAVIHCIERRGLYAVGR